MYVLVYILWIKTADDSFFLLFADWVWMPEGLTQFYQGSKIFVFSVPFFQVPLWESAVFAAAMVSLFLGDQPHSWW